jgi:hypothetical protein
MMKFLGGRGIIESIFSYDEGKECSTINVQCSIFREEKD